VIVCEIALPKLVSKAVAGEDCTHHEKVMWYIYWQQPEDIQQNIVPEFPGKTCCS
jgi:hypothetical protein